MVSTLCSIVGFGINDLAAAPRLSHCEKWDSLKLRQIDKVRTESEDTAGRSPGLRCRLRSMFAVVSGLVETIRFAFASVLLEIKTSLLSVLLPLALTDNKGDALSL